MDFKGDSPYVVQGGDDPGLQGKLQLLKASGAARTVGTTVGARHSGLPQERCTQRSSGMLRKLLSDLCISPAVLLRNIDGMAEHGTVGFMLCKLCSPTAQPAVADSAGHQCNGRTRDADRPRGRLGSRQDGEREKGVLVTLVPTRRLRKHVSIRCAILELARSAAGSGRELVRRHVQAAAALSPTLLPAPVRMAAPGGICRHPAVDTVCASHLFRQTLMDVVLGRKTVGFIRGDIFVNGHPKEQATWSRVCGCEFGRWLSMQLQMQSGWRAAAPHHHSVIASMAMAVCARAGSSAGPAAGCCIPAPAIA